MVTEENLQHTRAQTSTSPKTILVSCLSDLEHDPRVMREIIWLTDAGYTVETLGEGNLPSPLVKEHHKIIEERPKWTKPKIVFGLILAFFPYSWRFKILFESRIPQTATKRYLAGGYDLVVLNDLDLLPWAVRRNGSRVTLKNQFVHLDLHEYHTKNLPEDAHWRFLMNGFWKWLRRFIASPGITSRSVVAPGIGKIYEDEFGIPPQTTVRNAPPYETLSPTPVNPDRIELIYHGLGMWERGLRSLVTAMESIEPRFQLKLMLTGKYDSVKKELLSLVKKKNLENRITFAEPVAMKDVAKAINTSDVEVIFYEPSTPNLKFSLPNKFFEAIQGRLAIVVGQSPSMSEIVDDANNGLIVTGWSPENLAAGINCLTANEIQNMKSNSNAVAEQLSMLGEGRSFLASLEIGTE